MLSLSVIRDELRSNLESQPFKDEHSVYIEEFIDTDSLNRVAPEKSQFIRCRLSDGSEISVIVSRLREGR